MTRRQYRKRKYRTEKKKLKKNQYKEWTKATHDRERHSTTTGLVDSVRQQTGTQPTNAQHSTRHARTGEESD